MMIKKINISFFNLIVLIHVVYVKPIEASSYSEVDWQVEKGECYGEYDPLWDRQIYPKKPILLKKIYSDGTLHMSVPCFKGKLNGVQKLYYKNKKIQAEIPLKDNIRDGKCFFYYKDGAISHIEFVKDGYIEDNSTYYFPDGTIQGNCFYKKGLKEGRCYMMDYNLENKKEIRSDVSYVNGLREGLEIESQGAIFIGFTSIYYKKGQEIGKLAIFRKNKYHLDIRINHKKIKDKNHKIEKCIFSWYKKRGELLLDKGSSFIQKDLKNECFSSFPRSP
jgi:hypothetical protein